MALRIITSQAEWQSTIHEFDAVKVKYIEHGPDNKAIWFETINFGWILSAKDKEGKRSILAKF